MAINCYLAMTPGEVSGCHPLPAKMAWMACHFSASGPGISNLPNSLPQDAILILDDSTPLNHHEITAISQEMCNLVEQLGVKSVLLDFQRPNVPQLEKLAQMLVSALPCPVGVSTPYAQGLECPVFLPPLSLDQCLQEHLAPWQGREIWLDMAPGCGQYHIGFQGNQYLPLPPDAFPPGPFRDDALCCRYATSVTGEGVTFSLFRGWEELEKLLKDAEKLGVSTVIGLYQELASFSAFSSF